MIYVVILEIYTTARKFIIFNNKIIEDLEELIQIIYCFLHIFFIIINMK